MMLPLTLSLRSRVLLIVLVTAIGPLAMTGVWLAAGAERSGEDQLRQRLESSLVRAALDIGARWVANRSRLLAVVESAEVQSVLLTESHIAKPDACLPWPGGAPPRDQVLALVVRDSRSDVCWQWSSDTNRLASAYDASLDVFERGTGRKIGELEAELYVSSLLSLGSMAPTGIGAELALIDRRSREVLLPLPFDPVLASKGRFSWAGEEWLASSRVMDEPSVEIIATAPLTPYLASFGEARRRGLTALVLVTVLATLAVVVLTHHTTRSLSRLSLAATAVSRGELDRTVEVSGGAELAGLAAAFNTMTDNLRRTLAELARREAVAAVGEFAASLAHEVRNPLTSIRIDLQRLEERLPPASPLQDPLARALRSIARLDASVSGALRIARSGQLTMQSVDLRAVLDTAIAEVESEATAQGVTLVRAYPAVAMRLKGDAAALHQLFLNLLLNALQASDRGGRVSVGIDHTDRDVVTSVTDMGAGIPAELQQQIFEPFYSTKPDGTGLGLPIARRIALAHGGDVAVATGPAIGTTMVVTLPLRLQ